MLAATAESALKPTTVPLPNWRENSRMSRGTTTTILRSSSIGPVGLPLASVLLQSPLVVELGGNFRLPALRNTSSFGVAWKSFAEIPPSSTTRTTCVRVLGVTSVPEIRSEKRSVRLADFTVSVSRAADGCASEIPALPSEQERQEGLGPRAFFSSDVLLVVPSRRPTNYS